MARDLDRKVGPVGRLPRGPKSGKGSTLATRITGATRAALDEEAERTGRSISQVAEIWLDEARNGRASYDALLGGTQLTAVIEKLVEVAKKLREKTEIQPDMFKSALVAAWTTILPSIVPNEGVSDRDILVAAQKRRVQESRLALLAAVDAAPESDTVRMRLDAPRDTPQSPHVRWVLADERIFDVTPELKLLRAAGGTARTEIDHALAEQAELVSLAREHKNRLREAAQIGEDLAVAYGATRPARELS